MKKNSVYDSNFYSTHKKGMQSSAEVILNLVNKIHQPNKVIDVGCGQGNWLAAANKIWNPELTGHDGNWVDQNSLADNDINFVNADLSDVKYKINTQHDLCISLEVAEHLPENRAPSFVEMLTETAPIVLFSAAIPEQGGAGHINEQWQTYWNELFNNFNYSAFDIIRPHVWGNRNVEWWYRQNIILFIDNEHPLSQDGVVKKFKVQNKSSLNSVHPENYLAKMRLISKLKNAN